MTWICPKCDRELHKPEQRHYCERVSLDSLFHGRSPELILLFDKILAEVADWDGVLVGTTPNCIVFTHRLTFLVIRPMKKELDIKFYSKTQHAERPVIKSTAWGKKFENHIRLSLLDDLRPALFTYLRASYELLA
ncbi:DUF5655 domain-containing protein [Mucilaginibacter jinjuensis]|uniref:DUF5655 domain-containing protein n=1 Tax=Mucilaginibacter jinjuensis TaxID=1176721 RepID=A0ABY7T2N3_9SPHI|nr:DUF5655 domain-containing protein [Mucilaginibacter jinjuensis]WCT10435.1 DUF5655 domain-containing protein [Mucilaginibacter jinjuensis]